MKSFLATLTLPLLTLAQTYTRSAPFALVLQASNSTLNNTLLYPCHEGAAIDALCTSNETLASLPSADVTTFTQNTTNGTTGDPSGPLLWDWELGGCDPGAAGCTVESALIFVVRLTSNVANLIFEPAGSTPDTSNNIAFSPSTNLAYIPQGLDDTSPPVDNGLANSDAQIRNWYVCTTYYGYVYQTLVWKVGVTGAPQNPTCVKVDVKRVFV